MTAVTLDAMDAAAQWAAREADGATPSAELSIQDDALVTGYGTDGVSARITATEAAGGHRLRRSIASRDLNPFTELRLSIRADRVATGAPDGGFFLELRLGSAAMPVGHPANLWHRLLPVRARGRWETVKLGIDDLPPAVRGAVTRIELRCVDASTPFTVHVDDLVAVRPEMTGDADAALAARLNGIATASGTASAAARSASEAVPAAPAVDLLNFDVRFAGARVQDGFETRDHTAGGGSRLLPVGAPFDLLYAITPIAATRADQAALLDGITSRLAPVQALHHRGDRMLAELIGVPAADRVGGVAGPDPVLFCRVEARLPAGPPAPVRDVEDVVVTTQLLEA
jgi:hypothetical protein